MKFAKVGQPWRVVEISDSGYQGLDQGHLSVRMDKGAPQMGTNAAQVCRSTFVFERCVNTCRGFDWNNVPSLLASRLGKRRLAG